MKEITNRTLQVVRTPMFKQRVELDKTKYTRKEKHKNEVTV